MTLDRISYLRYARSMYCCYEYEYEYRVLHFCYLSNNYILNIVNVIAGILRCISSHDFLSSSLLACMFRAIQCKMICSLCCAQRHIDTTVSYSLWPYLRCDVGLQARVGKQQQNCYCLLYILMRIVALECCTAARVYSSNRSVYMINSVFLGFALSSKCLCSFLYR